MKIFQILLFILLAGTCSAQSKAASKYISTSFEVAGVCGNCEKRIEGALDIVGVSKADWVKETSILTVVYNPKKIKEEELHQLVANAGYRTSKLEKSQKAYDALPNCCKYDDGIEKH
ncbi:MAG: cation transporter [Bacteroidota bacterium]